MLRAEKDKVSLRARLKCDTDVGIINGVDTLEERISELEDRSLETLHINLNQTNKKKNTRKKEKKKPRMSKNYGIM